MEPYSTAESWTGLPGEIVPADGNYTPSMVAPAPLPAGYVGATAKQNRRQDAGATDRDDFDDMLDRNANTKAATPVDLGPNNERLEDVNPKVVHALRELVRQYREEGVVARRNEIRRIRQARLFWQGLQYAWWNPNDMNWHLPYENRSSDDRQLEDMPRYQFVTNFYQGFGLSFVAVLSQDVPSVRFYPNSAQSLQDISAARAASDVATLIEQNNKVEELLSHVGYFLWTDGKLGAYVRYVADGQRFGFHDENMLEALEIPLGDDVYVCPQCGKETPVRNSKIENRKSASTSTTDYAAATSSSNDEFRVSSFADQESTDDPQQCPSCGTQLDAKDIRRAERVTVPRIIGTRRVPNGQEVISIAGGLELNTPVWANEMHEYPYLQWQAEVHRAKLKAAYPHAANKIETSPSQGAEDVYARVSRLSVEQGLPSIHPGDALMNLITFDRTWLRPWAFYSVEDVDTRNQLLALFPDGCYIAFAGEAYCESRSESMDDHWRVLHALPGDGQNRPSVGDSLVQVQERYNVLSNMQAETYEYGIPPIYADPQVLDFDALANQVAEPAAHFPARARPGQPLAAGFFQPAPATVPPDMLRHQQDLIGPVAQFLTGLFPAIFGGNMEDVKTASGYALARDQAMGRLGLVWRRTKQFYADVMLLAVDCFRKNRPEDVEIPLLGPDGLFDSRAIRLIDLKGNISVHPEADETFPRLKSQQRAVIQQLFGINDPAIQRALVEPANLGYIKNVLGITELVIPGEDSRNKQLREIQQLLTSPPIVVPVQVPTHIIRGAHPASGAAGQATDGSRDADVATVGEPPAAPQLGEMSAAASGSGQSPLASHQQRELVLPSVPIDQLLDDHATEFEECKRWANSDAGQAARMTNPAGFANVRAHAEAHLRAMQQLALTQQFATAAANAAAPTKGQTNRPG
jgi:DNA-directed RNA polymerase subunit M/transcription elongation factor TFIIS